MQCQARALSCPMVGRVCDPISRARGILRAGQIPYLIMLLRPN